MPFIKSNAKSAYYKRYQTKYRRRREAKTDYYARRRLIQQDKNKYEAKKYRFVVRITASRVICQITYATPVGDHVICPADSHELKRFGLTAGLTNYASAYATGLLTARRVLKQLKLDSLYEGVTGDEINGEYVDAYREDGEYIDDDKRPFKAILDVGLTRTTTGNRIFGALKGLSDGGVFIKHNHKRFPGYTVTLPEDKGDKKQENFEPEVHRSKIFGTEIQEYLDDFKGKEHDYNNYQFSNWEKALKAAKVKTIPDLYEKVHAEIRKNPDRAANKSKSSKPKTNEDKSIMTDSKGKKWFRARKITNEQRKERVQEKLQKIMSELQEAE